jgi:hypothetical protein
VRGSSSNGSSRISARQPSKNSFAAAAALA